MNNSTGNSGLARLALLLIANTLMTTIANAAEEEGNTQTEPLVPDIELLEFLGTFQTESGEWIDPEMLLNDDFDELFGLAARMDEITNQPDENDNAASDQQDN